MPPAWTLGRELVTQDVNLTGAAPNSITDLTIPTDKVVVGSGGVVKEVWDPGAQTLRSIDSAPDWPSRTNHLDLWDGPHPTDATKWRFILTNVSSGVQGDPVLVRVWLVAVNPLT